MTTFFSHVNIIANDWRVLAQFYTDVFSCVEVPPQRNQSGDWLDKALSLKGAKLEGVHLRLPGGAKNVGSTLEIYTYAAVEDSPPLPPNRRGFGHIAFHVDDVKEVVKKLCASGGSLVGEIVETHVEGAGFLTFAYCRDPEGNIIEVQTWLAQ